MDSTLSIKRRLFPYGYESEYNLETPIADSTLKALVPLCLSKLLPPEIVNNQVLTNLKGREPALLINLDTPENLKPKTEELFFISGDYLVEEEDDDSDDDPDQVKKEIYQPFSISANTSFLEFQGKNKILYQLKISDQAGLLPEITSQTISENQQIELHHFRLGIQLFKAKLFAYVLGAAPSVTSILLIEANRSNLQIRVLADSLKERTTLPLPQDFFERLDNTTKKIMNFCILSDYQRLLKDNLSR